MASAYFFLHEYFVDFEDEVRAELRRDAVEIVIGAFISVELARFIVLRVVQRIHPCAFDDLDGVR